jgi:hypothetical protein
VWVARCCELQGRVLKNLKPEYQKALGLQPEGRNLEQALSRLRRIAALVTGNQTADELTAKQAEALDGAVCREINQGTRH